MNPENGLLSVSQLNEYIRMKLDEDIVLSDVWVRGEISNFSAPASGHLYFTLKDTEGQIRAAMFRSHSIRLRFAPANGMKVLVHGRVSVYSQRGEYQIYADEIQPDGAGALALQYEQLRRKLEAEGLFDERRKKELPQFPERIGVITSPTGAAVQDIRNILARRFPCAEMILFPSMVQGEEAPLQLIAGLEFFDTCFPVDVIIIGRGGGSAEDLWAFNDENLARRVAACRTPVISAVGHECDFTICDFAADKRAPTPSAAAELAVPDYRDLLGWFEEKKQRTQVLIRHTLDMEKQRLRACAERRIMRDPKYLFDPWQDRVGRLAERLERGSERTFEKKDQRLRQVCSALEALNPLGVLKRGYAAVSRGESTVCRAEEIRVGDLIDIRFADGTVRAKAEMKTENENG